MQNVLKSYWCMTQQVLDKLLPWSEPISHFAKLWRSWEAAFVVPAWSQSPQSVGRARLSQVVLSGLESGHSVAGGCYSWHSRCHVGQSLGDLQAEILKFTVAHFNLLDEISVSPEHKTCCESQQDSLLKSPAKRCWQCHRTTLIRHQIGHGSSGYPPAPQQRRPVTVGMKVLVLRGPSRGFRREKIYPIPITSCSLCVTMTHIFLALFDEGAGGGARKEWGGLKGHTIWLHRVMMLKMFVLNCWNWRSGKQSWLDTHLSSSWLRRALVDILDRPWIMLGFLIAFLSLINRPQAWDRRVQVMVAYAGTEYVLPRCCW